MANLFHQAVIATDDDLAIVASQRTGVRHLFFDRAGSITDDGMRHVSGLKNLRTLDISYSRIADAGISNAQIDGLPNLRTFAARNTNVGDQTAKILGGKHSGLDLIDLRNAGGMTRNAWTELTSLRTSRLLLNDGDAAATTVRESLRRFAYENYIDYMPLDATRARFNALAAPEYFQMPRV
jgi:hypothetical protein